VPVWIRWSGARLSAARRLNHDHGRRLWNDLLLLDENRLDLPLELAGDVRVAAGQGAALLCLQRGDLRAHIGMVVG
jgi:hypothetical protein